MKFKFAYLDGQTEVESFSGDLEETARRAHFSNNLKSTFYQYRDQKKAIDVNEELCSLGLETFGKSFRGYFVELGESVFEIVFDDVAAFRGTFDLVLKKDSKISLIQFHMGKLPRNFEDSNFRDNQQLSMVAATVWARRYFDATKVDVTAYYLCKEITAMYEAYTSGNDAYVEDQIKKKLSIILSLTTFLPRPGKLCNWCAFREKCPADFERLGLSVRPIDRPYLERILK